MLRRMSDGGRTIPPRSVPGVIDALPGSIMELNTWILWAAIALGIAQIPFIINLFWSINHGEKVNSDNPWDATTLDWQTPTPPPHGNFAHDAARCIAALTNTACPATPRISRRKTNPEAPPRRSPQPRTTDFMEIPYTVQPRPDTGIYNAKLGIWLFLASEVMLFGGLFSAYILLRVGAEPGMWPHGWLNVTLGTINTVVLALSAITTLLAWAACKVREFGKFKFFHACTILLAVTFLCIKSTNTMTNGFTTKSN